MPENKTKPIRVGVLGAGRIAAEAHIPSLLALGSEVEFVAACAPSPGTRKNIQEKFGLSDCYENPEPILARGDIDAVIVCSPNKFHAPLTIAALEAGKHVLCEKPMARNAAEAQSMAAAASKTGKILQIAVHNRFRGDTAALKTMIGRGDLGTIRLLKVGWVHRVGDLPEAAFGTWYSKKEMSGGGPLIDVGVHVIDLGWYLMGCPRPLGAMAVTSADLAPEVGRKFGFTVDIEELASGMIRFDGNASMLVEISWGQHTPRSYRYLEIYGTKAGAFLLDGPLKIFTEEDGRHVDREIETPDIEGHFAQVQYFINCIRNNAQPDRSPAAHGVQVMKILDAMYKSADTGREVRLDE